LKREWNRPAFDHLRECHAHDFTRRSPDLFRNVLGLAEKIALEANSENLSHATPVLQLSPIAKFFQIERLGRE
jgi:hypothetical protein